jgi:hypothetical protein
MISTQTLALLRFAPVTARLQSCADTKQKAVQCQRNDEFFTQWLGFVWQGWRISPLFHEGAQNFKLVNLSIFVKGSLAFLLQSKAGLETILLRQAGNRVFPKLSKLLNQEDALSVPCLRGDFWPRKCCGQA